MPRITEVPTYYRGIYITPALFLARHLTPTRGGSMRLPVKLAWKYGVVLVLFVVISVLNAVAVEQDYYKVPANM